MPFSFYKGKKGFTLIEIIIVIALSALLLTIAVQSVLGSTNQVNFTNTSEQVQILIRQARSLAISGRAQLDYTDFDKDNLIDANASEDPDYVTPAHYGVHFTHSDDPAVPDSVILFVDNHSVEGEGSLEGVYDPVSSDSVSYRRGFDIILQTYQLPGTIKFKNLPNNSNSFTLFYSTLLADVSFNPPLQNTVFFTFGLEQTAGIRREKCFQIHKLSGISEPLTPCPSL